MSHSRSPANACLDGAGVEKTPRSRDIGEEFLAESKSYLEYRSRGVEPPQSLRESWKRFYEFYVPRIRAFLRNCGLPDADLNDCSQEVWQDVVAKLADFRQDADRGRLSTWMMTVARNKAVDSIRRRNRHISRPLEDNEAIALWDPGLDPAAEFERRRIRAQVRRILRDLSGEVSWTSFQALYLRWIEGWPTSEVAATLDLTPEQVRFRVHRMKRKVRDMLERSLDGDASDSNPVPRDIDG